MRIYMCVSVVSGLVCMKSLCVCVVVVCASMCVSVWLSVSIRVCHL